jgi:hypothetical protein
MGPTTKAATAGCVYFLSSSPTYMYLEWGELEEKRLGFVEEIIVKMMTAVS